METIEMTTEAPTEPGLYWWAPTYEQIGLATLLRVAPSPVIDGILEASCPMRLQPFPGVLPRGWRRPAELGGWWSVRPLPRAVAPAVSGSPRLATR